MLAILLKGGQPKILGGWERKAISLGLTSQMQNLA